MNVINDPGRAAAAGSAMGQGLGQGLGQGIAELAQHKLDQMRTQKQQSTMRNALIGAGYNPQEASLLSLYPPQYHEKAREMLMQRQQNVEEQPISAALRGATNQQQQARPLEQFSQNPQQQAKSVQQQLQTQQLEAALKPYNPMDNAVAQQMQQKMQKQPQLDQNTRVKQPYADHTAPVKEPVTPKPVKVSAQAPSVAPEILSKIEPSPIQKAKMQTYEGMTQAQAAKQRNLDNTSAIKEQHYIEKQTKPYVERLDKMGGPGAKTAEMTLNRMERLIDSGKLTGATMYNLRTKLEHTGHLIGGGVGTALGALGGALIGGFGGSIVPAAGTLAGVVGGSTIGATVGGGAGAVVGSVLTPKFVGTKEDQEFRKLSQYFLTNMKDIFGSRVTQQEVQIYLDSIPTLALTDEGKKAVINDMKLIASGWKHKKQIKDQIIEANHRVVPSNIEQLVEEANAPFMDDLARRFTEGTTLSMGT